MAKSNKRFRNFNLMYYEEHASTVARHLKSYADKGIIRAYYLIQHQPEAEKKQVHYHCVIEYYNAKTISAVSKNLELEERFIQDTKNVRTSVCYLIHKYESDKIHYCDKDVYTNDFERLYLYLNAKNDNDISESKIFFNTAFNLMLSNLDMPFYQIQLELSKSNDFDLKLLGRYGNSLLSFYNSLHYSIGEKTRKGD